MAKYRVQFARTTWLTANVEAEDEEQAIDEAYGVVPGFTAHEAGWGSHDKWSADAGEWAPVDEFLGEGYSEEIYGPVVELVEEDE